MLTEGSRAGLDAGWTGRGFRRWSRWPARAPAGRGMRRRVRRTGF